ncbi:MULTISPECIES: autotransporter outer membrane beta-barrel domain-containing protein [unclassified Bradyrhizobium]|uniref:autotransporter outer membrane beta-barrel domain-containing protein n=1 Tax=unclassified Bradyrhizobium TaxID=2631580 RepID=UPI002FF427D9
MGILRAHALTVVTCHHRKSAHTLTQKLLARLVASTALAAATLPAAAQDATWLANPGSGDFNTGANWNPATVPTGTALFGTSSTTGLSFSAATTVGGWTFNPGAAAYTFTNNQILNFNGAGIVINGGSAAITNNFLVTFAGSSTAGSATIVNNLVLDFTGNSTTGSATIITANGGTTQLTGNSSGGNARFITQAGGSFDISDLGLAGTTAGSIEGAGTYFLGSKQFTAGSNNLSTTVSGVIQDGGSFGGVGASLVKVGTGTLTLAGANAYTGATTVDAGTLVVNGSIAASSLTSVNAGAMLSGTGTAGNTQINSGGIFAPGSGTPGTSTTVAGDLAFQSGAVYLVQVNPATASSATVTGTATLGGTVNAVFQPGSYNATTYTILSSGTRVGTFDALTTTNLPAFLTASLAYAPNEALLTLVSNLGSVTGLTPNERAVASALDAAFNAGNGVFPGFGGLTPGQFPAALDALSGEVHASTLTTLANDSGVMRSAVLGRLRQAAYLGDGSAMGSLALGGPLLASVDQAVVTAPAYAPQWLNAHAADLPAKAPPPARAATPDWTFWAQGVGAWGQFNSDGNAAETKRSLGAFIAGADRRWLDGTRAGLAAGYTSSRVNVDARASAANIDSAHLAGYLGHAFGAFNLRSGAAAAWHEIGVNRTAAFPGFFDMLQNSYHGNTVQAFGEVGYGMSFRQFAVEPFAGLAYVRVETGGFNELGGAAALTARSTHYQVGYTSLGMRTATTMAIAGSTVMPHLTLAWQHALGDVTPQTALAFLATGAGFTVAGVPLARDAALIDAGFDAAIARNTTVGLSYVGQLADTVQDHAVRGRVTVRF